MSNAECEPAYKLFIHDLSQVENNDGLWTFKLCPNLPPLTITHFQIQGTICNVTGFKDEILIVSDGTGKAKVTRGPQVPGDFSWLKPGVGCSVVGNLSQAGKLPHIAAIKLAKITSEIVQEMWPLEVSELKDFLSKKIIPDIAS